ncbi:MAG: bifunctional phosphopantothenoylcysteine decarboxylase/phosphopantothenate--cysteine ligase CoaBC [Desulfurococcaceae archaeon]
MAESLTKAEYKPLSGKNIVVGLTASSSIYRSIDLMRMLLRLGASVKAVMTKASTRFIGPDLVEWAIGEKVFIRETGRVEHIELAKWSDMLLIAPATVKTISKIAYGLADELLTLLAISMNGLDKKIAIVPTMNIALYKSMIYKDIERKLVEKNIVIIPPFIEEDRVKYPPLDDLVYCVDTIVNRGWSSIGLKTLVTTGPTREYIDPVRVITNPSSGYMGVVISRELACRGFSVDLVHGPVSTNLPYMVNKYSVETTVEMANTVSKLTENQRYDIAIFAAAPVDYTVLVKSSVKISSREQTTLSLNLKTTPKVVKQISRKNKPHVLVIFAAETVNSVEQLIDKAREKLVDYNADIVVANNIKQGVGFSSKYIDACIITENSSEYLGIVRKEYLARIIVDKALDLLKQRKVDNYS